MANLLRMLIVAAFVSLLPFGLARARAEPASQPSSTVTIRIAVDPSARPIAIPADFIGLGYETSAVAQRGYFSPDNRRLVRLYRNLGSAGLIRIGGNISDHTQYRADAEPVVADEKGTTLINRSSLEELAAFARATGWTVMWGLNLGTGTKEQAAEQAVAVERALGDRLHSFQIGNEVDLLRRFNNKFDAYYAAFAEYKSAIRAALPGAKFSGPDTAWDMDYIDRFLAEQRDDLVAVTTHYYRGGAGDKTATLEHLLAPDLALAKRLDRLRDACDSPRHLPSRINETNSFYGGGKKGVSDTFGSALWALDYLFVLASHRCGGVNIQTDINQLGFISHYSPVVHDASGVCSARPEYYGLLAFAIAGRGTLLPIQFDSGKANVTAYLTETDDGVRRLTLINKDAQLDIEVDASTLAKSQNLAAYTLRADSLTATTGVTFGGVELDDTGTLPPPKSMPLSSSSITIPHGSVAVVEIR